MIASTAIKVSIAELVTPFLLKTNAISAALCQWSSDTESQWMPLIKVLIVSFSSVVRVP